MNSLGARAGFWFVLILFGMGAGGWFMWGQVSDARARAEAAEEQVDKLGKRLEQIEARQAQTDASLATRRRQSDELTSQLSTLRSDLQRINRDDPATSKWASDCVPAAVADRMRLPPDKRCPAR